MSLHRLNLYINLHIILIPIYIFLIRCIKFIILLNIYNYIEVVVNVFTYNQGDTFMTSTNEVSLKESMINNLGNSVIVVLENLSYNQLFIGGSRRFGYNIPSSDMDIFVYVPRDDVSYVGNMLKDAGFISESSIEYPGILYNFKGMVHVVMIINIDKYLSISRMHVELDEFIKINPWMIKIAIAMKNEGIKGRTIFSVLYNTMKHMSK